MNPIGEITLDFLVHHCLISPDRILGCRQTSGDGYSAMFNKSDQ